MSMILPGRGSVRQLLDRCESGLGNPGVAPVPHVMDSTDTDGAHRVLQDRMANAT